MSTSPTEGGITTGSNPAGVASPSNDSTDGNTDRTELRSVRKDTDSRPPRRPALGDIVEIEIETGDFATVEWLPAMVVFVPETITPETDSFQAEQKARPDLPTFMWRAFEHRDGRLAWRWPGEPAAAEPPPVRRCTVQVDRDGVGDECGTVIGDGLVCDVCKATRCFEHCGGIDHFRGEHVDQGGSGSLHWKIAEIAAGRFQGQVWRRTNDVVAQVLGTISARNRGSAYSAVNALLRRLETGNYMPPAVTAPLDAAANELLARAAGKVSNRKRAELLLEVVEWLRECEEEWNHLEAESVDDMLERSKRLHDLQVAALFARIGGAL